MSPTFLSLAMVLAGLAAAPVAETSVTTEIQLLRMKGRDWQTGVKGKLELVAERGGVTVWTASDEVGETLKRRAEEVLACPRMVSRQGMSAVVKVAKVGSPLGDSGVCATAAGEGTACQEKPCFFKAAVQGRSIDQGVLAQVEVEVCPAEGECEAAAGCRVTGEWLVPKGGVLVMSLGDGTSQAQGGKAKSGERLVVVKCESLDVTAGMSPTRARGRLELGLGLKAHLPIRLALAAAGAPGVRMLMVTPGRHILTATEEDPAVMTAASVSPVASDKAAIPQVPSRGIPQAFNAHGAPVELPPLPPESTAEPVATAEPMGTPQAKAFRPATPVVVPAPVSEPVPVAVSELVAHESEVATPSRYELTGGVTIRTRDGTVMEAERVVVTPAGAECPGCEAEKAAAAAAMRGFVPWGSLPFENGVRFDSPVEFDAARGPGLDVDVEAAGDEVESDEEEQTFVQRIPVLGGAIELKVRVSRGKEAASNR